MERVIIRHLFGKSLLDPALTLSGQITFSRSSGDLVFAQTLTLKIFHLDVEMKARYYFAGKKVECDKGIDLPTRASLLEALRSVLSNRPYFFYIKPPRQLIYPPVIFQSV